MFKRDVHHYHVVEIEKGAKLPEITGDLRESLKALALHPGFVYLLQRFKFQKAAMETALREGMNLTETQLRYLQAGIFWAGQFDRDIATLTRDKAKSAPASTDQAAEFEKVRQSLEMIG